MSSAHWLRALEQALDTLHPVRLEDIVRVFHWVPGDGWKERRRARRNEDVLTLRKEADPTAPKGFISRIAAPLGVSDDRHRLDVRRQLRFPDGTHTPGYQYEFTACHADRKPVLGALADEGMIGGLVAEPDEPVPAPIVGAASSAAAGLVR